jgi:hypothetical protein
VTTSEKSAPAAENLFVILGAILATSQVEYGARTLCILRIFKLVNVHLTKSIVTQLDIHGDALGLDPNVQYAPRNKQSERGDEPANTLKGHLNLLTHKDLRLGFKSVRDGFSRSQVHCSAPSIRLEQFQFVISQVIPSLRFSKLLRKYQFQYFPHRLKPAGEMLVLRTSKTASNLCRPLFGIVSNNSSGRTPMYLTCGHLLNKYTQLFNVCFSLRRPTGMCTGISTLVPASKYQNIYSEHCRINLWQVIPMMFGLETLIVAIAVPVARGEPTRVTVVAGYFLPGLFSHFDGGK